MTAPVLPPYDGAGASVHHEVSPLVDERNIAEFEFLGWHEPDGEIPDKGDAKERETVFSCKNESFRQHIIHFYAETDRF
jgi:hypothetical protein